MEIAGVIIFIILLFVFKSVVKVITRTTENVVTGVCNEIDLELAKETMELREELKELGDDLITPKELSMMLQKKRKKQKNN